MSGRRHTAASLAEEARAFDVQMRERLAAGHVPDLRRCGRCEWFDNNPWRDEAFVDLTYGERFRFVAARLAPASRVLEAGCGPGFLSLELSRAGHDVTGVDVSPVAIDAARETAASSPPVPGAGALRYEVADFLDLADGGYDAVVFSSSLHHFANQDRVAAHVERLLATNGAVCVMEPCRERLDRAGAAVWLLAESLLSAAGAFWRDVPPCREREELDAALDAYLRRGRWLGERGERVQSPHDMEAGMEDMLSALGARFAQEAFEWEYAFFGNVIGGMRLGDRRREAALARHMALVDACLVELGALPAVGFRWFGRKGGGA
ncbi:SAM-dependent methyltransferase [Desulfobaculum xiamenense]|uniref:SAM-dependent methyltransferase n=1 Tax=Desulfobaculum xiamenense TaxID=995050 RepID=A0A846QVR3_9BACT|nr:class I SAM-dependent methyltransferase [Desulfobaculum xiamenense]NJB69204.1 SAM-dependent methyltransferase [Desulfobaculum xiamenense]